MCRQRGPAAEWLQSPAARSPNARTAGGSTFAGEFIVAGTSYQDVIEVGSIDSIDIFQRGRAHWGNAPAVFEVAHIHRGGLAALPNLHGDAALVAVKGAHVLAKANPRVAVTNDGVIPTTEAYPRPFFSKRYATHQATEIETVVVLCIADIDHMAQRIGARSLVINRTRQTASTVADLTLHPVKAHIDGGLRPGVIQPNVLPELRPLAQVKGVATPETGNADLMDIASHLIVTRHPAEVAADLVVLAGEIDLLNATQGVSAGA